MASLMYPPYLDVGAGLTPSDGSKLYFYVAGSGTLKDTFTTAAATTPNANPVVADEKGVFPAIYLSGDYDWVLDDKNDVQRNTGSVSEIVTSSGLTSDLTLAYVKQFSDIASMLDSTTIQDNDIIRVASYHADGFIGGSDFKYDADMAQTAHNGGAIIAKDAVFPADWTNATQRDTWFTGPGTGTGCFVSINDIESYISQFGAKPDNDSTDNRQSIQACINYCTTSGKNFIVDPLEQTWDAALNGGAGGYVNVYFGVGTFHPLYVDNYCLVFEEPRNMFVYGNTSRVSSIRYYGVSAGDAVVKFGAVYGSDWGYVVNGLGVSATADETDQAGCVMDYAVLGRNDAAIARCSFSNCTFAGGLIRAAEFHGYMMDFDQTELRFGQQGGLMLNGPANLADGSDPVTTSITLKNVWSRQCGGTGIYFRNQAWYVNLISCGVDGAGPFTATAINRPEWAYQFGNVRGMTINSCGAEEVDRVLRMVSCDSVNIVGMKGTGWGKTDGTVADYAMEITGNGTSVNISGWPKGTAVTTGVAPTKKYNYVIGVTKSDNAMGSLLVQIMDNGINYLEAYHVANTGTYTKPIVWPNDTADGAHRAQRKTGNTTWPNKDIIISPADGQYGTDGCLRKVINITGEATATTHQILMHYGGLNATTYNVSVTLSSQAGATAAKWDGVANVTSSGKNVTYFTKTSGNSTAAPTLAWNGDALEFNANVNFFESIIDVIAYSNNTVVSAEFLL